MTKSEMELLDSSFLGPGLLVVNQYFNTVIDEYYVLWACFVSTKKVHIPQQWQSVFTVEPRFTVMSLVR